MADALAPPEYRFPAAGETGALIASRDWSPTSLGPIEHWPQSLRAALGMVLLSPVPMVLLWGEDGVMLYNDAYSVFAGGRHPQLLGSKVREGWPEVAAFNDNVMRVGLSGGTLSYKDQELTLHRHGRPEQVWMNLDYSPVFDDRGSPAGVIAIVVETTERVLAERRVDAERKRLINLFHQAPGFICIMQGPDHIYEFTNRTHDRLFQRDNIVGKPIRQAFPDLEGQGVYELLDEVYATGKRHVASNVPLRYSFTPGGPMEERILDFIYEPIVEENGAISGIFCEGYDVTEGQRAQEALRRSEAFSQRVLASSEDCIKVLDTDGRLETMSEGGRRALGVDDLSHLVGQDWPAMFEPESQGEARNAVAAAATGEAARFEGRLKTRNGELRYWDSLLTPVMDTDGRPERILALSRDVTRRRKEEATLREGEARFRNMADSAPVMIWVTEPDGTCIYLNRRWYEYTGQRDGAGEGLGWLEAVHPDDRPLAEQAFLSANAQQTDYRVDFRLRRADGVYRWTIDAAAARFASDGTFLGYVGSVIDIDERREAEARLAYGEEQLRLAIESAEVGLWDLDPAADILFWPPRVKAMFGISPDVPISMDDFSAALHPEDKERTLDAFASALDPEKRSLYDVEYRTIGKEDGVVRWIAAKGRGIFDEAGKCVRVIGTAIDISARKATEQTLRDLNDTLEQRVQERTAERNRVWSMSRDLFAVMGFDGYLKAINPAWETTLGYDEQTLLSMPFPQQVHPDDHSSVAAAVQRLQRGETIDRFEDRLRHADGSWRWIAWGLVPEGDVFYAVGRDVTAEKAAADELERAQDALRQAQKMEAVGQLTGGIAHDFNNLLGAVVGNLDLIRRRPSDPEKVQRWAENGMAAAERGTRLTGQLLAFSRAQRIELKPVIVSDLVENMQDMLARALGPMVRLTLDLNGSEAVLSDPTQLEMAILNLAINARDAMPDGGALTVSSAIRRIDADTELGSGQYLELAVADTGVGMPPEVVARAFDPFFTTKGVGKGTGLGLSQVYGIARQTGGTVRIDSRVGAGTTIRIYLPMTAAAADPETAPQSLGLIGTAATARILVVDDDEDIRRVLVESLDALGYDVVEAHDGPSGLKALDTHAPDLMMIDFAMPGMNGAEVAKAARERRPELPIVFASGYADTAAIEGVVGPEVPLLRKPFRMDQLQAVVGNALDNR